MNETLAQIVAIELRKLGYPPNYEAFKKGVKAAYGFPITMTEWHQIYASYQRYVLGNRNLPK